MIRTYKYRAFQPIDGVEAFDDAVALRRSLWATLCGIHRDYLARREALFAANAYYTATRLAWQAADTAGDKPARREAAKALKAAADQVRASPEFRALTQWRVDRFREAKQDIAAQGLHWGSYNAVVFQFEGAVGAAAANGGVPEADDRALGEAVVNQFQNGLPPHRLLSSSPSYIEYLPPSPTGRSPGSRRSRYRQARLYFAIRTERNPKGAATIILDVVLHRPLPPNMKVVEIRVIRRWRDIINRDGLARQRADWFVTFVVKGEAVAHRYPNDACGVAFAWGGSDDGVQGFAVSSGAAGVTTHAMPAGHNEAWAARRDKFDAAERMIEGEDRQRAMAEARIFERRLRDQRKHELRSVAAGIAKRHGIVVLAKLDLRNKGVKNHVAPHEFKLALQHAVEAAGGRLIEVAVPKSAAQTAAMRAKYLHAGALKFAAQAGNSSQDDTNAEADQCAA